MSDSKDILYEKKDRVGIITINRPEVRNAMTYAIRDELRDLFAEIKDDPDVGAVIITGAGDMAFISGADISELRHDNPPLERKEIMMRAHRVFRAMETIGKPVIAAINGVALGGGMELAMACTIRIASKTARFGQPEIKLGMIPGYGGTQRLPRIVGVGRALEILLTGEMISAEEALRIGLVNQVVPLEDLMPTALELAKKIARMPALAVKFLLEAVDRGMNMSLDQALEFEADLMVHVFSTEDAYEGLQAFLEKREPVFKGK
jgi:enoyl-CoA hydratase